MGGGWWMVALRSLRKVQYLLCQPPKPVTRHDIVVTTDRRALIDRDRVYEIDRAISRVPYDARLGHIV